MNNGDKVKFINPENEEEAALVMTVIEDRGNRILVETPLPGFGKELYPQNVFAKSDLVVVSEQYETVAVS